MLLTLSELHKNRLYGLGWKILLIQNLILLIPLTACIPIISGGVYQFLVSIGAADYESYIINYIFNFALILDLIAISLISLSVLIVFQPQKEEYDYRKKELYIPILGFLWVILSVIWRFPFLTGGGFDLGLSIGTPWKIEDNDFYMSLLNNIVMIAFQLSGAICLFFFLNFQEKYHKPLFNEKYENAVENDLELPSIGRINLYGLLNIISVVLILMGSNLMVRNLESQETYGYSRSNGFFLFFGLFFKASIIPLLAIVVCWKFISLKNSDTPPSNHQADTPPPSKVKFL